MFCSRNRVAPCNTSRGVYRGQAEKEKNRELSYILYIQRRAEKTREERAVDESREPREDIREKTRARETSPRAHAVV